MDNTEMEISELIESTIPGISVMQAVDEYFGSMDIYLEVLKEVINTDRNKQMEAAFERKDYKEYRVCVHTLKGILKSVGLFELADDMEALQKACDAGDTDFINNNHQKVVACLNDVINKCKSLNINA